MNELSTQVLVSLNICIMTILTGVPACRHDEREYISFKDPFIYSFVVYACVPISSW